ncbi:FAD-dependent oxidoreductase, partial [bacterium]|nr:FAD-dependent oxidoreductase [bacterium]
MYKKISVIGGGLAGCEAAYQISKFGINVDLYE